MEIRHRNFMYCLIAGAVTLSIIIQHVSSYPSQPRYYRSISEDGVERVVEIVPSSVTVRPRPRQRISSAFAKQYWTSGNFFNRDNIALNDANDDSGVLASASFPRPLIFRAKMVPVIAEESFHEL